MKKYIIPFLLIFWLVGTAFAIPPSPPPTAGAGTGDVLADGSVPFTGSVTLDDGTTDSPSLIFKDSDDETVTCVKKQGASGAGYLQCTTAAGDGFQILTGNLKVGNGTPGQTINGEDAYIEGLLEVDGVIYADGGVTGNAATATALASDPTDCPAGQIAIGIAANGNLTCTATPTVTTLTGNVTGNVSGSAASLSGSALPANSTVSTSIAIGSDPADTGAIRLSNAGYIYSEASPAGTDISVIGVDSSEIVQVGASGASGVTVTPAATFSSNVTVSGTLSAGASGFSVDADGDVTAKSFTVTKVNNTPGQNLLYSSHGTDTTGAGWQGPSSSSGMANSYYLALPEAEPSANQVLTAGAPSNHISSLAWGGPYATIASPTFTGKVTTAAPAAVAGAGFNLPHGTAPDSPSNGDCWTTTSGLYCRINGSTIGPYATAGGSPALDDVANPDAPKTFTLLDNDSAALSFGSTGKADILKIITTDSAEGVTMSGTLTVTGAITGTLIGTATNLSGTPALPNGTTATTQSASDNSTKLATTAYVDTGLGGKQASDDDLTTWAGITPSANLQTFLSTPNAANFETAIGAGAFASDLLGYANAAAVLSGIGAQAYDTDLAAIAALSCSQDQIVKRGASAWECGTDNDSVGTPTNITVADTTDTTSYVALFESATGDLGPKTDAGITYNAGTGMLTVKGLTTGSGGITTAATAAPTNLFNDSDAPGTDKEIGKIVGGYVDGADGSENGTLDFNVHQAGTTTSYVQLDGKNVQVEINKPLVLLSSDDPDTSAANQMTFDTDGWLRVYSTSQKALARIQEEIHVTVYKPNDMDDAQRDHFWIWSNESGMSFIVTGWKGWSTSDDTTLTIYEEDADGANDATVDAVELATGSGPYTGSDTTITGATIENGHLVYLDFDDTDAPALVKITIYGYYNADVN